MMGPNQIDILHNGCVNLIDQYGASNEVFPLPQQSRICNPISGDNHGAILTRVISIQFSGYVVKDVFGLLFN